jgi:hypothetical protein
MNKRGDFDSQPYIAFKAIRHVALSLRESAYFVPLMRIRKILQIDMDAFYAPVERGTIPTALDSAFVVSNIAIT